MRLFVIAFLMFETDEETVAQTGCVTPIPKFEIAKFCRVDFSSHSKRSLLVQCSFIADFVSFFHSILLTIKTG